MADVGSAYNADRADLYLAPLRKEWGSVSSYASEWEQWSEDERLTFVLEWPGRVSGLSQLREWDADRRLSSEQAAALKQLEGLIKVEQPAVTRLLAEPSRSSRRAS